MFSSSAAQAESAEVASSSQRPAPSARTPHHLPPAPPLHVRRKSLLKTPAVGGGPAPPSAAPPCAASSSAAPAQSPRMRRFAERLAVIQISLDPPSPPEFALQSPDEHSLANSHHPFWADSSSCFRRIEDSLLLQVPRALEGEDAPSTLRQCSPPPRRCSYASTLSENSSISLNTSYQSLLFSPACFGANPGPGPESQHQPGCGATRSRSSTYCSEGEADTPPTNEAEFVYAMAAKEACKAGAEEDSDGDQTQQHRSKRSLSHYGGGCQCGGGDVRAEMRQRRSHSAVSTKTAV